MAWNIRNKATRNDASRSRQPRWLYSFALAVIAGLIFVPVLMAVHDLDFQLDGDVSSSTVTHIPAGQTQLVDWDTLFDAAGATKTPLPTGFGHARLDADFSLNTNGTFNTEDPTTYTTGSKDTLPIGTGWQCTVSNNVNSKVDLINAYAADYIASNGDRILYFGLERNVNTGDANIGFWFLQSDANCVSNGTTTSWTGHHLDGDILVVSAFTKGGNVSTINAYEWVGNDVTGSLNPTPIASGADCRDPNLGTGDTICAAANRAGITTPWTTVKRTTVDNSLDTGEFFEGGINLTKANIGAQCFNTFIGDTRSSQSLTATIFDYARGVLGQCAATTTTQSSLTGTNSIGTGSITASDTATINVSGVSSFNGTVSFYLCGPSQTQVKPCDNTNGVKIGTSQTITVNGQKTSDTVTLTQVGVYCWGAVFSGDSSAGVPASQDDGTNECFTVGPVMPTLATTAGADVAFGLAVSDTASLAGTANQPGTLGLGNGSINPTTPGAATGLTITFTLYGPDNCTTVATGTGTNPQSVAVSGDGTYGPVSFTPNHPGTFHWVAAFDSGTNPNTLDNTHNSNCSDTNEDVVVSQIPSEIKTRQNWIPNDQATISSTNATVLPAGGSVVFTLYNDGACGGSGGTSQYTESKPLVGGAVTEEVGTGNTGTGVGMFKITTGYDDVNPAGKGPFSWKVVYTPPAGSFTGKRSACTTAGSTESFSINYHNDAGPGVNLP